MRNIIFFLIHNVRHRELVILESVNKASNTALAKKILKMTFKDFEMLLDMK